MAIGGGPPGSVTDEPEAGGGPPPGGGSPGGGPSGPPPGGGGILAAMAQRQQGPQVSAPGAGDQASSMSMVQTALGMLSQALPGLMGSPLHQEVAGVIAKLGKRVNQGSTTSGIQQTQIRDLLQSTIRNAMMQRMMSQGGGQGQQDQGGPAGPVPPGAQAQAPMPSTPLPGA